MAEDQGDSQARWRALRAALGVERYALMALGVVLVQLALVLVEIRLLFC